MSQKQTRVPTNPGSYKPDELIEPKHTPTPWNVEKITGNKETIFWLQANGSNIFTSANSATIYAGEDEANAAFIVRAVNSHDEMIASLKDILSRFKSCIADGNGELSGDAPAIKTAETLIAKAEGK